VVTRLVGNGVYVHRAKDAVGSDGSHANTPKDEVVELWWDWQ
jgi:hypothetical protein